MSRKNRIKKERALQQIVPATKPRSHSATLLKVALTFAAVVVVLEVLVELVIDWSYLQLGTAALTTYILQLTGLHATAQGINVTLPNARWEIVADCTAIGAQVIFLAFVVAVPSSAKAKALGLVAGVPFIFAANVLRLVALAWLTAVSPSVATFFHDFVWQMGFLFLVVGMWFAWLELVVKREKNTAVPA